MEEERRYTKYEIFYSYVGTGGGAADSSTSIKFNIFV